jgi:proteasome lid subunit RPN8/RPN11
VAAWASRWRWRTFIDKPPVWVAAAAALDAAVAHARDAAPDECCGLIIGARPRICGVRRAANIHPQPRTRFLIDPRDHLAALKAARRGHLEVVGFYHSHPRTTGDFSATDLAEATYPNHLFLIVGLGADRPDIRLFWFDGRNFLEAPFVTVPE